MAKLRYLLVAAVVMGSLAHADSIRVGNTFYRDVYIKENKDFYYICEPETGEMERISKRRSNVSDVDISTDEAYRAQLLARYEAAKNAGPQPEQVTPPTAVRQLDGDILKHREQMKAMAVFETQLDHWRGLSPERQVQIQEGLVEDREWRAKQRAADHQSAVNQLEVLGTKKEQVETKLDAAARARRQAVTEARATDDSQFYLRAYENSKGYVGPYYYYYRDDDGDLRAYPIWYYKEDPSLYNAAITERARTDQRIGAAERAFAERASMYGETLTSVEQAMTRRERDALATLSKAVDEQRRLGSRQSRIAALKEAAENDYRPQLRAVPIESWQGTAPRRTPTFTVSGGPWRITCTLLAGGSADEFSVTIYDAETDQPFTRISDPDFLGMRMRVFDDPGEYYLVVEQGIAEVPYEIDVSLLTLK